MYCPNCGDQTTQGLKYCKRCGAGLGAAASAEQQASTGKAMGAMLFLVSLVSIAGFIALFATIYNLGERPNFDPRTLIGIMAFGGGTVLGVVGLLVWLLLRFSGYHPVPHNDKMERPLVRDYVPQQLPASSNSIPSVTENTTRNFDKARYRDRDAND